VPLFHHKSDDEKRLERERQAHLAQEQTDQRESLAALSAGGIPVQAQRRLDEVRASEGAFYTSDLSVNEFLLARQVGYRPLSQVMGSSMYHMGWRYLNWYTPSGQLDVSTNAMNEARALALGRLAQEASRVGASVVVGVHVSRSKYEWSENMLEFSAIGTAMRLENAPPEAHPALTNLSGQDFWKLYQAGYWPRGVVASSCVYHVVPTWRTQSMNSWFGSGRQNQELTEFTQGLYAARHLATRAIHRQASDLAAEGIVGMAIEQEQEEFEVSGGNDQERTDYLFTFQAIGTAIVQLWQRDRLSITPTLNLSI